jgi:hypothetical protein
MSKKPDFTAVIYAGESISITIDGDTTTIPADAPNFDDLCALAKAGASKDEIKKVLTPAVAIQTVAAEAGFELRFNPTNEAVAVFLNGTEINSKVSDLIVKAYMDKADFGPLKNFLLKAMSNRDAKEADVLYDFVVKNRLPIHPDGDFLAFKSTRPDGFDHHSGTVQYRVGEYLHVKNADLNKFTQCSTGLHIGGRDYVKSCGGGNSAVWIIKVNPADTIFYRADGQQGKMRVSKLFVYAQTTGQAILETILPFMTASSPEGDLLETAAKKAPVGKQESGKKGSAQVVKQMAKGKGKAEKAVVREAKKEQSFVTKTKKALTFSTKGGVVYTAKQVLDGVSAHGQRGWAAATGIARTTIQEWIKMINGEKRDR